MKNQIILLAFAIGLASCNNPGSNKTTKEDDLVRKSTNPAIGLVNPGQVQSNDTENNSTELGERISIKLTPFIPEYKGFSNEERAMLSSRLNSALAQVGYGGEGSNPRFIIGPAITILNSEVTSGAPTLYSTEYEINLMVADIVDETIFASYTVGFMGVGQSPTKSFINGFRDVNLHTAEFYSFLRTAEQKINEYYSVNCDKFILQADAAIKEGNTDVAFTILKNIPVEATNCYKSVQDRRMQVFTQYLRGNCNELLLKMKAELGKMNDQTASGYNEEAMTYYALIDKDSPCYAEAERIYQSYLKALKPAQKRDWELKVRQMEQQMTFRTDSLNAMNAFNIKVMELETQAEINGNNQLLEKYKEDYYYDRLPWLRKVFHLGALDPFDGYRRNN